MMDIATYVGGGGDDGHAPITAWAWYGCSHSCCPHWVKCSRVGHSAEQHLWPFAASFALRRSCVFDSRGIVNPQRSIKLQSYHCRWDWNANSGDTGGMVLSDWVTIDFLKPDFERLLGLNPLYAMLSEGATLC